MACIQQFLRESGGYALEQLQKAPYFLKIKQHKKYPNLYLFKYDQINSKMQNPIVQEARGIILDSADNWKIVSYPYNKFFNYGEPHAVQIDWNSSIIYEKEDGSLMTLYYYKNEWHVSSSGVPDASGNAVSKFAIENRNMTFHQLFWKIWKELNYPLPEDTEKCYIFEMLSPFNQIIVPQKSNRIVLHGVRCLVTLQEHRPEPIASKYGWELIRSYSFNNMEEVLKFSNNLSPSKSEGYVVCDAEFLRIKVKARTYVELAHMSSKMSMGDINLRLLKIAQTNEGSEVLTHFPEYNEPYEEIKKMYKAFVDHVESIYEDNKHHKTRKELAGAIKGHWFQSCIFLLFDERIKHANEWTSKCDTRKLLPHLNEYKTR